MLANYKEEAMNDVIIIDSKNIAGTVAEMELICSSFIFLSLDHFYLGVVA